MTKAEFDKWYAECDEDATLWAVYEGDYEWVADEVYPLNPVDKGVYIEAVGKNPYDPSEKVGYSRIFFTKEEAEEYLENSDLNLDAPDDDPWEA